LVGVIDYIELKFTEQKFHGISDAGVSGTKNSMEFRMPESPGRKIPWNFGRRSLRDEKFHGIPDAGASGTKLSSFIVSVCRTSFVLVENTVQIEREEQFVFTAF
jgi:hypothetical protein